MSPSDTHNAFKAVTKLAVEAAAEHVERARFSGEDPDPEMCMGLWQTFQGAFPKDAFPGDYDLAVTVFDSTFKHTVRAMAAALEAADEAREQAKAEGC